MSRPYSNSQDIAYCRKLHRQFGTTYYFATIRFPESIKWRVHGLYGFVRVADEWIDNPGSMTVEERRQKLEDWRESMVAGMNGVRPDHPAMRVFCDAALESGLPLEEAHCFLDAMVMDLDRDRYQSYTDLQMYTRGSASAIGVLMCYVMGATLTPETVEQAKLLGEAMQLTNFLRDIREDYETRGRIYLPLDDLERFGVEEDIRQSRITPEFVRLMQFEIERARNLYAQSDRGIAALPEHARKAVLLARILYSQILGEIEKAHYDVYANRARTSSIQKLACAFRVFWGSNPIVTRFFGDSLPAR